MRSVADLYSMLEFFLELPDEVDSFRRSFGRSCREATSSLDVFLRREPAGCEQMVRAEASERVERRGGANLTGVAWVLQGPRGVLEVGSLHHPLLSCRSFWQSGMPWSL